MNFGSGIIKTENSLDILGIRFSSRHTYCDHVEQRVNSARRAMHSLSSVGMAYPGLSSDVKIHLWKTIGSPSLLYGMDGVHLTKSSLKRLDSFQGSIIKQVLGFNKRSKDKRSFCYIKSR